MKSILTSGGVLRVSLALLVVLGVIGGALVFFVGGSSHPAAANTSEESTEDPEISVKIVLPHFDKKFSMIEKRPAEVHPYYVVPLDCRVAGEIKMIHVDKGSIVKKGDVLVEIKVPEREADRDEKQAALDLAKAQVEVKKAAINSATADWQAAETKIKALEAKQRSDESYLAFRQRQHARYAGLLVDRAIDEKVVDEQEDRWVAARETVIYTKQAVLESKAQERAAKAKIEQATAERDKANREVEVANAHLAHAKALLEFATIRAPFDGEIVDRNRTLANEGAIVQTADTHNPQPLLTIQSKDLVTVVMRVPDNFAPYITSDTEVIFETAVLPGVKIKGKVTRFPHSLVNKEHDRTMIVEVDLWTGDASEFEKKMKDAEFLKSLKNGMNPPVLAGVVGKAVGGQNTRLLPGMFGHMTLLLRHFENAYMLPSASVVIQGGNPYVYVVQDGKAHLQSVKIQVDDGKLVKIELLNDRGEVLPDSELKDKQVIVSNQGELSEGQPIKPVLVKDWRGLKKEKQ